MPVLPVLPSLLQLIRRCAPALCLLALPAGSAVAASAPRGAGVAPPIEIPRLVWRERVLANGLQVVAVEDHASPTVSVQVWYRVGSKDDPEGRSGFAHLFEHLMFKGARHLKPEQIDRLTEDVGGSNNASTDDDYTNYFEVVPSNYLESLLWAEAERMAHLNVDAANFQSERAVVEEEYRLRVLAEPYGRLFNAVSRHSYQLHPYRRPGIGNIAELNAATLDDVVRFHATYYRPDNAVLIVVGDFEPARLDAWVERYFAGIPRPAATIPRVTVQEPARRADREVLESGPGVPLPAVVMTWLAPPATSPDLPALEVAAALLAGGQSARLNQNLVYRDELASDAGFYVDTRVDTGLLVGYAIAAHDQPLAKLAPALLREIRRLAERPPGAAELDKVKTQLLTHALERRQTALGKGMALGHAILIGGNAARVNTDLTDLRAVTAADVQRVVRRYIANAPRVTIRYQQEAGGGAAGGASGATPAVPVPPAAPAPSAAALTPTTQPSGSRP